LPAARELSAHRREKIDAFEMQVLRHAERKRMRDVKGRWSLFGMSIKRILWKRKCHRTCAWSAAGDRTRIIERLRPGVARLHSRSPIAERALQRSLQRMIARMRIARDKLFYAESADHVAIRVELRIWGEAGLCALKSVGERDAR